MSRCECCQAPIAEPMVRTIAGEFMPPWGICRRCWRLVGKLMRRAVIWARVAFKLSPHLEESIAYYWLWELALSEARARRSIMARAA